MNPGRELDAFGESPAHAICLAALRAVGVKVPE